MHNDYIKYILDIEPINDIIILITFDFVLPITSINCHAPIAQNLEETKDSFYALLHEHYDKHTNQGPTYLFGDFNARIHCRYTEDEHPIIGPIHL